MRKLAEQFRAERHNPPGGYVMFYRGQIIGWWDCLRPAAHFKSGVIAVPEYYNAPCFIADGEPKQDAAERWERMDPQYEPTDF